MQNDGSILLATSLRSNGHFSPLTLSIMEESSVHASWRSGDAALASGFETAQSRAERREQVASLSIDELLQWMTSIHEHNHFLTHTGSAYGLLITHVQLLRHAFLVKMSRGEVTPGVARALTLYDQVLLSLTGYAEEWTQAHAAEALNEYFVVFKQPGPRIVPTRPNAPACPDYRFAYPNLLEAVALVVERRYAANYAPHADEATIFRYHARDHSLYFHLLASLTQVLELLAPSELALKVALSGPVPVFGREEGEYLDWESFHPGYRLVHMIGATQLLTRQHLEVIEEAARSTRHEGADREFMGSLHNVLNGYLNAFAQTPNGRGLCLVSDEEISVSGLRERMTDRALRFFDQVGFEEMEPILAHGLASLNETQRRARISPIVTHLSSVRINEDDPMLKDMLVARQQHSALFSLFAGELRSEHMLSKPKEIALGLLTALRSEIMHEIAFGRAPRDAERMVVQRYTPANGAVDELVAKVARSALESLGPEPQFIAV